jgi:dihydrofolate reductase
LKVSAYIATSLDGFIARENGDIDWLPAPGAEDYGYKEFIDTVDVLIMGRNTFLKVLAFPEWPYGNKRVIVLSHGSVAIPKHIARFVKTVSCSPCELAKQLSEEGARHVYVDGGKTIREFLDEGLIQQLIITRIPILIGSGIPLFGEFKCDIRLRHIETRPFPDGLVQSRYEVIC